MTFPPCCFGQGDQVGQVGAGHHRRLVDDQQGARLDGDGAAGAALAGEVAEELGAVVGLGDAGGQGVAGGLGRGDADDRAEAGGRPGSGDLGQDAGLARAGGGVDHRDAPAVGEHRQRGGGLVLAQPGPGALRLRVSLARPCSACSSWVRSAPSALRGGGAGHARRGSRGACATMRSSMRQLRAGGVADAAVAPVDAAPVGAQQGARDVGRFGGVQAQDRLEL